MKKILIMETEGLSARSNFGKYRCYSKDISMCNIARSIGISPEINMDDSDVLPCDNSGYYLIWSGDSLEAEELLLDNLKVCFDKFYYTQDTGWDFDYLEDADTYIQYIIDHKDELGISEFFD